MNPTHLRVPSAIGLGVGLAAAALTLTAACADDDDGAADAFCDAALAAEAASMSEDPAAIEAAFTAAADAAPTAIKPAVDTVIAEAMAGNQGSPAFTEAYGELTGWATTECGFAQLAVTASDYAFAGLPDTVAAGPTVVELDNTGTEFHQIMLMRINDDRAGDVDGLRALGEDEIFAASTPVGGAFAAPGETGTGMLDLHPGRYVAICFLPTGATPPNMAAIEAGEHHAPAHYTVGMVHPLTVV